MAKVKVPFMPVFFIFIIAFLIFMIVYLQIVEMNIRQRTPFGIMNEWIEIQRRHNETFSTEEFCQDLYMRYCQRDFFYWLRCENATNE